MFSDETQEILEDEEDGERSPQKVGHLKVFAQQGLQESVHPIFEGDNFIGRQKCEVTIPLKSLSKRHACVEVHGGLHLIYDCESKNRTKKGKASLKPLVRYELKHGDMLTIADVRCQYVVGDYQAEADAGDTGSDTDTDVRTPPPKSHTAAVLEDSGSSAKGASAGSVVPQKTEGGEPQPKETRPIVPAMLYSSDEEMLSHDADQNNHAADEAKESPSHVASDQASSSTTVFKAPEPTLPCDSDDDRVSPFKSRRPAMFESSTDEESLLAAKPRLLTFSDTSGDEHSALPRGPATPTSQSSSSRESRRSSMGLAPTLILSPDSLDERAAEEALTPPPQGSPTQGGHVLPEGGGEGRDVEAAAGDPEATQAYTYDEEDTDDEDGDRDANEKECRGEGGQPAVAQQASEKRTGDDNKSDHGAKAAYNINTQTGQGDIGATQPYTEGTTSDDEADSAEGTGSFVIGDAGSDVARQTPERVVGYDELDDDDEDGSQSPSVLPGEDRVADDLQATQAYGGFILPEPRSSATLGEEEEGRFDDQPTVAYAFDETQAYGSEERASRNAGQSAAGIEESDPCEATQAYGIDDDQETDDEELADSTSRGAGHIEFVPETQQIDSPAMKPPNSTSRAEEIPETQSESEELTDATGAAGGSPAFVQETPWIGKKTRSVAMEDTEVALETPMIIEETPPGSGRRRLETPEPIVETPGADEKGNAGESPGGEPASGRGRRGRKQQLVAERPEMDETPAAGREMNADVTAEGFAVAETPGLAEDPEKDVPIDPPSTARSARSKRGKKALETESAKTSETRTRKRRGKVANHQPDCETPGPGASDVVSQGNTTIPVGEGVSEGNDAEEGPSERTQQKKGRGRRKAWVEDSRRQSQDHAVAAQPGSARGTRGKGRKAGKVESPAVAPTEASSEPGQSRDRAEEDQPVVEPTRKARGRGKKTDKAESPAMSLPELPSEPGEGRDGIEEDQPLVEPTRKPRGRGKKADRLAAARPEVSSGSGQSAERMEDVTAGKSSRSTRGKRARPTIEESSPEIQEFGEEPVEETSNSEESGKKGRRKRSKELDEKSIDSPVGSSKKRKTPATSGASAVLDSQTSDSESKPRVIFTGLEAKQSEKIVKTLGGVLVQCVHDSTHLVTDKVRRTVKFLCGLGGGQKVVQPSWLEACKNAKAFVDAGPFLVKDKAAEKQFDFSLARSHELAQTRGLLDGLKIHVTKNVRPEPVQMEDIIVCAKGQFLPAMPKTRDDNTIVVSCEKDRSVCLPAIAAAIPVCSAELLLSGILRQELQIKEHQLFTDATEDSPGTKGKRKRVDSASAAQNASASKTTKRKKR